jgi:hypothetical protein
MKKFILENKKLKSAKTKELKIILFINLIILNRKFSANLDFEQA